MQISFRNHLHLLARHTIVADKEKLTIFNKNLLGEWQTEYDYRELSDKVVKGKYSDSGWSNLGWIMLSAVFAVSILATILFPNLQGSTLLRYFSITTIGLAILFFLLYFILKQEFVTFYQTDTQIGFVVYPNKENSEEVERFVKYVKDQIVKGKVKPRAKNTGIEPKKPTS